MADIRATVLTFEREATDTQTDVLGVYVARQHQRIGTIRWSLEWRQYVFGPAVGCIYNARCLDDIRAQLVSMMDAWARAKGNPARLGASKFDATGTEQPEAKQRRPSRARSGDRAVAHSDTESKTTA